MNSAASSGLAPADMKVLDLHSWDVDYRQAVALQRQLAARVKTAKLTKTPHLIAGVDCAFTADDKGVVSCISVLRLPELVVVEVQWAVEPLRFPYIPGLLSFREAPACIAAAKKLKTDPDIVIVDGHGVAHPRRFGIASHLGILLDKPTIGCAKSCLTGSYSKPGTDKGACTFLRDGEEVIGAVLRTRSGVKPVFVSVGHRITLAEAIESCLSAVSHYRLPEPTRLADQKVTELKRMRLRTGSPDSQKT
jgi:deoxyribonuclease V